MASKEPQDDSFVTYDLKVEVICPPGKKILCNAKNGDYFILKDEMLYLPPDQGMSIYNISAALPLLQAKQRKTHPNDWMSTDDMVACPDPYCPSRLKITRCGESVWRHSDVSGFPPMQQQEKK